MGAEKISIFLQDLAPGGAERMMLNLAQGLVRAGVAVDLVLVRKAGPLLGAVPAGVRLVPLGTTRTWRSIPTLARYLRRERPAALLAALMHVNVAAILAVLLAGRCSRVVVSERSTISREAAEIRSWSVRAAYRLVPWVYPKADGIVAVSHGAAEDLAGYCGLPLERVAVINNPVIRPEMPALAAEPVEHPWFAPGEPPVVLGVGRLSSEKEFNTLIRAVAEVRRTQAVRLVILGEGPQRRALEALLDELGLREHAQLPGYVRNPYAYMARAGVLALSSRWEGSPNVLVEAMGCGTPVVATDCPNGPAEILERGRYGRLVPIGDPRALAEAIAATLARPCAAAELRAKAASFTVESAAAQYLDVLLGRSRARRPSVAPAG